MSTLNALLSACQTEQESLLAATRERVRRSGIAGCSRCPGHHLWVTTRAMTMIFSRCARRSTNSQARIPNLSAGLQKSF